MSKFFQSRDNSNDPSSLQKSFADSILNKLALIKGFGPHEGAQVNDALHESPIGEMQTKRITDAVEELIQKNMKSLAQDANAIESPKAVAHRSQFLKHWWNYMKQSQVDYLNDPKKGFNSKLTLIAEMGMAIGCNCADEQTKKWALAMILLCHYQELPAAQQLYDKLQDIKAAWFSEFRPWHGEILTEFPENPRDLPTITYKNAYGDEPPVCMQLSGISTVADCIPLRTSSKLLKLKKTTYERSTAEAVFAEAHTAVVSKQEDHHSTQPVLKHEVDDPEEAAIKQEYELRLASLRAKKLTSPMQDKSCTGSVQVLRNPDGSLTLVSKDPVKDELNIKAELGSPVADYPHAHPASVKTENEPKAENKTTHKCKKPKEANDDDVSAPQLGDLDPYTRAAIAALDVRNKSKAAAAAEKKGGMKRPAAAGIDDSEPCHSNAPSKGASSKGANSNMKRPAAAGAKPAASKATSPKKRRSAKDDAPEVPKSRILQSMPKLPSDGSNPEPVRYNGGIIYTAQKTKKFRALKVRGNNYTEASAAWGGAKPTKDAWTKCVKAIEQYHKK